MKISKWIPVGIGLIILVILGITGYAFIKPKLEYYQNQTGPQEKYLEERKVIFGNLVPTKEISPYTGEFAARFDLSENEWEMVKRNIINSGMVSDGSIQPGETVYGERSLKLLFSEEELTGMDKSYSYGKSIKILGKDRGCDYIVIIIETKKGRAAFFYYKVYQLGAM